MPSHVSIDGLLDFCGDVRPVLCLGRDFGVFEEAARGEDEHFADHVWVLLVAAHKSDHTAAGCALDDGFEALAHDVLECHALVDDGFSAPAFEQAFVPRR